MTTEPDLEYLDAQTERQQHAFELSATESSWAPVRTDAMGNAFDGKTRQAEPAVLEREDGVRLLYPGRLHAFIGETESCKTWAALVAVAQELVAGNCAVMVDLEDTFENATERLRQLGVPRDAFVERFVYCSPGERFDEVAEAHLYTRLAMTPGQLTVAVVDSMTEAMAISGLDPDRGSDVASFHHGLPRWLAEQGAAVVLIDHVTKSRTGRGRWAIGSERKLSGLSGAAFTLEATKPFGRGMDGHIRMTVSKDRVGYLRQYEGLKRKIASLSLSSSPTSGQVVARLISPGESENASDGTDELVRDSVLTVIGENPGINTSDLRTLASGSNAAIGLALVHLKRNGLIRVEQVGKASHHYLLDED